MRGGADAGGEISTQSPSFAMKGGRTLGQLTPRSPPCKEPWGPSWLRVGWEGRSILATKRAVCATFAALFRGVVDSRSLTVVGGPTGFAAHGAHACPLRLADTYIASPEAIMAIADA